MRIHQLLSTAYRSVAFVGLAFVGLAPAHANEQFCRTASDPYQAGYYYCADATAGSISNVLSPDRLDVHPVTATQGGGSLGSFGAASATAGPLALRAYASSSTDAVPPTSVYPQNAAISHARVFDSGPITAGSSGAPDGTPVVLRFTALVEGLFVGFGEAQVDLSIFNGFRYVTATSLIANRFGPFNSYTFDVGGFVIGDSLSFLYSLQAEATSTADPVGFLESIADASNTALLYVDFLTPGVRFDSASGRDYSSSAVVPVDPPPSGSTVPEPSTLLLLSAALIAVPLRGRVRRRAP